MNGIFRAALAVVALTVMAGCGGGADRTKAQVRLVNASDYAQLDLRVHDELRQNSVAYANTAGYVEIDPGKADTQVTSAGSATALLSFTPSVSKNNHYSLLAFGAVGALKQVQLDEEQGQPDTNKTLLRVVNAASDAGSLDVYLTAGNEALSAVTPVQSGAAYGTLGGWLTVDSRTWQLRVTAAGSKTDLRLSLPSLVLGSRRVATLVLTSGKGGLLVNALFVVQQGTIDRLDGTHARVRGVAAVTGSSVVTAQLGDTTLMSNIASSAVGNYVLVTAGPQTLAVTAAGTAMATTTQTLAAGSDYTVLVYGTPAAPLAVKLDDDNHLPTDSTTARIRLVNGVSGLTNAATLTVDATPIGSGTQAGQTSGYDALTATTAATIRVVSPGTGTLFSDVDRTLAANSTYTVFVLGSSTAPTGVLRRDR